MSKKHLGFGFLISFSLLTYFLYQVAQTHREKNALQKQWMGNFNQSKVYLDQLKALGYELKNPKKDFEDFVDSQVLSLEAKKLDIDVDTYLSFFDRMERIPLTKEEKIFYPNLSANEILSSRKSRAKKNLLSILKKDYQVDYCYPCSNHKLAP
ncbi:MAG: hypothetical protein VX642_09695 [Bdellovibrionota bacterium]|nr:hypothetical protein [Bdellovibrionota bacterium]